MTDQTRLARMYHDGATLTEIAACIEGGQPMPEHTSDDPIDQAFARQVCKGCPLRAACLREALEIRPTAGTWGGKTFTARTTDPDRPCRICGGALPKDAPNGTRMCSDECRRRRAAERQRMHDHKSRRYRSRRAEPKPNPCPTCGAKANEPCRYPSGEIARVHNARITKCFCGRPVTGAAKYCSDDCRADMRRKADREKKRRQRQAKRRGVAA